MAKPIKKRLVCVHWIDADGVAGWFDPDDKSDEHPVVLRTFGLYVQTTKNWVITATTYDPVNKQFSDRSRIPRGMVKKVENIRDVEYCSTGAARG